MKSTINRRVAGGIIVVVVAVAAFAIGHADARMQDTWAGAKRASDRAMSVVNGPAWRNLLKKAH